MSNRLQHSTSPYLQQHADNPVDWYEWGEEAFAAAQQRQVPILLSIGYSSCHWCHVMAHESFSDPKTAAEMNRMFVNIKVDREERPDIDHIYMTALQALTGQGGWPLTAWLTPDREPFYTGTYFPPTDRPGHPSFGKVMDFVDRVWREERERVTEQTQQIMAVLNRQFPTGIEPVGSEWRQQAQTTAQERFDPQFGGFGSAPKFAQPPVLDWLLTEITDPDNPFATTAKQMLSTTLSAMERGGIKDLIGGGFARYAVDRTWLVPHFEKMLYDNASLLSIYARSGRELDQPRFIEVAKSIAQYLARELQHPAGGFYAAEDADSEGVEGKFYVWSWEELQQVCGDRLEIFAALTGASPAGNFEGSNILHHAQTSAQIGSDYGIDTEEVERIYAELCAQLYQVRSERIRPMRDEKIISGWNGLAIGGLSHLAAVTGDNTYIQLAEAASRFVLENLVKDDRLHRSWSDGEIGALGFAEDYGAMATGLFSLYQVTGDLGWYEQASQLTRSIPERFGSGSGGFYDTSVDHEQLISRPRDWLDNPIPSGNSLCIEALMILAAYTGEEEWHQQVTQGFTAAAPLLESYPLGVGHLAAQAVSNSSQHPEVAVAGPQAAAWADKLGKTGGLGRYYLAWDRENQSDPPPVPLLEGRSPSEVAQGFVCSGFVCQQPANSIDLLLSQLQR